MKSLVQTTTVKNQSSIVNIIKGIILSYGISLLLLFIFSVLLTYTSISESMIPPVILFITINKNIKWLIIIKNNNKIKYLIKDY